MHETRGNPDDRHTRRNDFSGVYEDLNFLQVALSDSRLYLKLQNSKTAEKIEEVFADLEGLTAQAKGAFQSIEWRAGKFDVDTGEGRGTPGNGYWSVLIFIGKLIHRTKETVNNFTERKSSWFFSQKTFLREIRYIFEIFLTLTSILNLCKEILSRSEKGNLILNEKHSFQELLGAVGRINQYCLFGRFNSSQFSGSIRKIAKLVSKCIAVYSEIYYRDGRPLRALWRSLKILINDDELGMRFVTVSQFASPSFFISYIALTEKGFIKFALRLMNAIKEPVSVNKLMLLEPESLTLETVQGNRVEIPVPSSHIGSTPLPVRLLSKEERRGMYDSARRDQTESTDLLLHFHGGGFVGHSSQTHEVYLRRWSRQLGCPIVSVDYSLSPRAPHPRPVEEAFFAYCYLLTNPRRFGWTGDKIVLAGDSAGGFLVAGVLLKIVEYNIRPPTGVVFIYTPFLLKPVVSPGRFLNFLDPVFSAGLMAIFVKYYTNRMDQLIIYRQLEGKMNEDTKQWKPIVSGKPQKEQLRLGLRLENDEIDDGREFTRNIFNPMPFSMDAWYGVGVDGADDPILTPLSSLSEDDLRRMPPISFVTADFDPFVDDNVEFARRLKSAGVETTRLWVLEGLNHGFLYFSMISEQAREGSDACCQLIIDHLKGKIQKK